MSQQQPPLVGSIVERASGSNPPFKPGRSSLSSGFPVAQHRSKSAFARAREAKRNGHGESFRAREIPKLHRSGDLLFSGQGSDREDLLPNHAFSGSLHEAGSNISSEEQWKEQMRRDNDRAIEAMTIEERERHAAEILDQLGPNVGELLHTAKRARGDAEAVSDCRDEETGREASQSRRTDVDIDNSQNDRDSSVSAEIMQPKPTSPLTYNKLNSPPRGILVSSTPPTSRSSTPGRTPRKLRFAEVTPNDVHVFQSEPSSPRKPIGLLLPPPPKPGSGSEGIEMSSESIPEEGTPEDIRRRFFPHLPAKEPALEWMVSEEAAPDSEPRFDLSGAIIPISVRDTLPTHLGLHHHGGSTAAGYTLSDLLLLARSSVPAQRATVLGVLSKVIRRVARGEKEVSEIKDRDRVRSRALLVGLAALPEKGSVGIQAVDLVWSCIVHWDENIVEMESLDGVELRPLNASTSSEAAIQSEDSLSSTDPISSLPFSALLPQFTFLFKSLSLPPESLSQLLSILRRFARHSIEIATAITESPRLVGIVVNKFLLTPIPPPESGPDPDPLALDLLYTLALSSRSNARSLEGPADALLRFVTTCALLSNSPFTHPLADALLGGTLRLYSALARYGFYSGVATTAADHLMHLSSCILNTAEDVSDELRSSWLELLSVWMICARDPHQTTPTHDLLWSQVAGWGWGDDLSAFRNTLLSGGLEHVGRLWGIIWDALASWLEGCRVNSAKAGKDERDTMNASMESFWSNGIERETVGRAISLLTENLSVAYDRETLVVRRNEALRHVAGSSQILSAFSRLCLACLPKPSESAELDPKNHDIPAWIFDAASVLSPAVASILSRSASSFDDPVEDGARENLQSRVHLLHFRPVSAFLASFAGLSRVVYHREEWLPLSIATLETLLPGDEESAGWLLEEILEKECSVIECSGKLHYLKPFFKNMIRPDDGFYLSPLVPTPESIQRSTTQCLSAHCTSSTSSRRAASGLPLQRDWPCTALDHLLRSGTSPILTNSESVPESWNASEIDLVQASLSLMHHVQMALGKSDSFHFDPTLEHVVFNCMKVFMLEHNQRHDDSAVEVFRDATVGRLMDALLNPFTLSGSRSASKPKSSANLETVAKRFLGAGTPFFQFYTDFVALYDAISFSHNIFARLLLPPTSMGYAADYRKLLWGDFGHTLRTIRTSIEDVPALDLMEFLWPVEIDSEMLVWYLRALMKWQLFGFVRFLAIHHISGNIWPDMQESGESNPTQEKHARMLLLSIFNQAKTDVVRDVVGYVQVRTGDIWLPPACYLCGEETKLARVAFVRGLGETRIAESMEKIFAEQK